MLFDWIADRIAHAIWSVMLGPMLTVGVAALIFIAVAVALWRYLRD